MPDFFPFIAYDEKSRCFLLREDRLNGSDTLSIAYMVELPPFLSLGEDMEKEIHGLITGDLPEDTYIQFGTIASTKIFPILDEFERIRNGSEHGRRLAKHRRKVYEDMLEKGIAHDDLPVTPRTFRCFLTIRAPIRNNLTGGGGFVSKMINAATTVFMTKNKEENIHKEIEKVRRKLYDRVRQFRATIRQLGGNTSIVDADGLISLADEFVNGNSDEKRDLPKYNPNTSKQLRDYIVSPDSYMKPEPNDKGDINISGQYAYAVVCDSWPCEAHLYGMRDFFGGAFKRYLQIPGHFCFFVTIRPVPRYKAEDNLKFKAYTSHGQANSSLAKLNPKSIQKNQEYTETQALMNIDANISLARGTFHGVVFGRTKEEALDYSESMIKAINSTGFVATRVGGLNQSAAFVSLLPGMVGSEAQLKILLAQTQTTYAFACSVPWVADWPGYAKPSMLFLGRRGQLQAFDLFASQGAYSFVVAGMTGSGKSFFLNDMLNCECSMNEGAIVRHIDYGRSAADTIKNLGGRVLDVGQDVVIFNPIRNAKIENGVISDSDEFELVVKALMKMAATGGKPTVMERRVMEDALTKSTEKYGEEAEPDTVYEEVLAIASSAQIEELSKTAHAMCISMQKFCLRKRGVYGKYVNGTNAINYFDNPIVSLELEALGEAQDLINVLLSSMISIGFQEIRTLPRNVKKYFLIDEAWRLLVDEEVGYAAELGVRTFRKRRGCFGILTQGLSDLASEDVEEQKVKTGKQILESCDYTFVLRQKPEAVERVRKSGCLYLTDEEWNLMGNLEQEKGLFAEVFLRTPYGNSVSRVIVDRYSYFTYTSDGAEVEQMEQLIKNNGYSHSQAAEWMVENWGK